MSPQPAWPTGKHLSTHFVQFSSVGPQFSSVGPVQFSPGRSVAAGRSIMLFF